MLLQFSVENFLSFKKKKTFTLKATSIKDDPKTNIISKGRYKILRTAAIYGANSSGKSNFVKALATMGNMVVDSVKLNDDEKLDYEPFLLSSETENKPTHFEIAYLQESIRYRYGFEYDSEKILGEWLFIKEGNKDEEVLFIRNEEGIGVADSFKEGEGLEEKTNDNRLFLSLVAQLGGEISKKVISWFTKGYSVLSGLNATNYSGHSKKMFVERNEICEKSINLFKELQFGFENIIIKEHEIDESAFPKNFPFDIKQKLLKDLEGKKTIDILTVHKKYNGKGEIIGEEYFNLEERESSGTNKLFDMTGPIFDSILKGKTLIIDELDAKMHPLISQHIIQLFNNPETNPLGAQLIFTTHDTHLLSSNLLRRDQIWFTEKDQEESTDLYSMMDIVFSDGSKPRNDSNYEKNYINGRYGAIPYIHIY